MAKTAYVATIQVLVTANSGAAASDAIHALLEERSDPGFIIDWGYLQLGAQRLAPCEVIIADDYEEGDMFE